MNTPAKNTLEALQDAYKRALPVVELYYTPASGQIQAMVFSPGAMQPAYKSTVPVAEAARMLDHFRQAFTLVDGMYANRDRFEALSGVAQWRTEQSCRERALDFQEVAAQMHNLMSGLMEWDTLFSERAILAQAQSAHLSKCARLALGVETSEGV